MKKHILMALLGLWSLAALAQETTPAQDNSTSSSEPDPITALSDDYLNSIELLNNRFRIDYKVDEVTMVFFREYGSAPVVLVRPDGSKLYASDEDIELAGEPGADKVHWFDDVNYDLIRIKEPMPGPWQAVGAIKPDSRIMVVSDLMLDVEPLPQTLFKGEVLKVIATLSNNGEPIQEMGIRDVVELEVELVSTNNAEYDNFGSGTVKIATFRDDGRGMDERPADGLFTGQFNLRINAGQWVPVYRVRTELFSREQRGEPLELLPNPFELSVELDKGDGRHHLFIDSDHDKIDMESVLIDGKVRYPNGDVQNFSLTETGSGARVFEIVNYEYGMFRAKVTAFGNTASGRDFIMDVPEFSFLAEEKTIQQDQKGTPQQTQTAETAKDDELASSDPADITQGLNISKEGAATPDKVNLSGSDDKTPEETASGIDTQTLIWIIVVANIVIVAIGGGMIWFLQRPRKSVPPGKEEDLVDTGPSTGKDASPKAKEDEDLLDLSMPGQD